MFFLTLRSVHNLGGWDIFQKLPSVRLQFRCSQGTTTAMSDASQQLISSRTTVFFFNMKMVPLRRLCWNYFQTAKQKCPKILGLGDSRATEICQRPKRGSGRILVALETSIFCLNPIPFERQADYCSYVMLYPMSNVDANQTGCWYPHRTPSQRLEGEGAATAGLAWWWYGTRNTTCHLRRSEPMMPWTWSMLPSVRCPG